jgi:hypothetical protein
VEIDRNPAQYNKNEFQKKVSRKDAKVRGGTKDLLKYIAPLRFLCAFA